MILQDAQNLQQTSLGRIDKEPGIVFSVIFITKENRRPTTREMVLIDRFVKDYALVRANFEPNDDLAHALALNGVIWPSNAIEQAYYNVEAEPLIALSDKNYVYGMVLTMENPAIEDYFRVHHENFNEAFLEYVKTLPKTAQNKYFTIMGI